MPTPPTDSFTWATDATYTGGPEAGTDTKTAPSGARQLEGFEPNTKPAAQNFNWLLNIIGQWLAWLDQDRVDTYPAASWVPLGNTYVGPVTSDPGTKGITGAVTQLLPLVYPIGTTLKSITIRIIGNDASDCDVFFVKRTADADVNTQIMALIDVDNAWHDETASLGDEVVQAGEAFFIKLVPTSGTALTIGNTYVTRTLG